MGIAYLETANRNKPGSKARRLQQEMLNSSGNWNLRRLYFASRLEALWFLTEPDCVLGCHYVSSVSCIRGFVLLTDVAFNAGERAPFPSLPFGHYLTDI
jgi:hypothetical protein